MKIGILGCLSSFHPSYSVATVILDQLRLLSKYHNVVFITTDDFIGNEIPSNVEIRHYPRYKHSTLPEELKITFFEPYLTICSAHLERAIYDCTHLILHDILFLHDFVPVNCALRLALENYPKIKILSWQHSCPSLNQNNLLYPFTKCYEGLNNTTFIYLNHTDIPLVAKRYNIPENKVAIVHNFIDLERYFKLHPLTIELVNDFELLKADSICVYPSRLVAAKQPNKLIKLIEHLNKYQDTRLIICNSWTSSPEEEYLETLKASSSLGNKLIFTSEYESKWCKDNNWKIKNGVPSEVTSDLLRISDLFILPSIAECCSLIMLEASLNKNLMVINDDLWNCKEWGGQKLNGNISRNCLYQEFGSITRPISKYDPSEEKWFENAALEIMNYQKNNQAINFFRQTRQRHNPEWVYTNQIEPLL